MAYQLIEDQTEQEYVVPARLRRARFRKTYDTYNFQSGDVLKFDAARTRDGNTAQINMCEYTVPDNLDPTKNYVVLVDIRFEEITPAPVVE